VKVPEFVQSVNQSGVVATIFNFFQGRATAFALVFSAVGIRLAFMGKLDGNYALFVTAIQGLIFCHSCKEDWHEQRMEALRQSNTDSPKQDNSENTNSSS
jgi:DNA-binding SARP family transcriptional activator